MHLSKFIFFYLVFIFFSAGKLLAQSPSYIHYDITSGLPTNEIYSLKQDRKGFLWIGTDAGLVRYDGNSFFLLNNPKSRGASASGLMEDAEGKIWFNNFNGQLFYANSDSVTLFKPWEQYYKRQLIEFTIDNHNNILVSNNQNFIYRFQNQTSRANAFADSVYTKQTISKMYDGSILFTFSDSALPFCLNDDGSVRAIPIYDLNGNKSFKSPHTNKFQFYNSYLNKRTLALQRRKPDENIPILYYYENAALHVHPITTLLQQMKLFPLSAYDDDAGNIFVGTETGLLWIKKNGQNYYIQKHLLKSEAISSILKGSEGGIWFSTLKNGIFQIPDLNIWFSGGFEMGLKTEGVSHLTIGKGGNIFAASIIGEIFRYQKFSNTVAYKYPISLEKEVQAMEYDSVGDNLFISKLKTEVFHLPTKTYTDIYYAASAKDFFFRKDGFVFSSGDAIVGSVRNNKKLFEQTIGKEFNVEQDSTLKANARSFQSALLVKQRNKGIWYQEKEKVLWVGFVDGLQYHENNQWVKYTDPETKYPIIAVHFSELKNGTLCVATTSQGLYLIKNKKIIKHLTTANGLLNNRIKRVATEDNFIWMVLPGAVQGYNIKDSTFKQLTYSNDADKQEIYDVAVLHDTVYLATSKGILFFPETINTFNKEAPYSSISYFNADNKNYPLKNKLLLPYSVSNISIELQGVALKSAGNFVYQYRLLGTDTNWVSVSASQNIVRYASLPPGNYIFESRVVNEDGVKSKSVSTVAFKIDQQWWKRWWFITFIAFLLLCAAYASFTIRIKALQKKNVEEIEKVRVLEDMRNSQLSALKAQMNPHFMFNALNSIQEIILMNDKKQANMYLGKFADLMRITLDQSNKNAISLEDEIKSLKLYLELEALRFEEYFQYELHVADLLYTYNVHIPAMLIQPYVENAIKHGLMHKQGDKKLELFFSLYNDKTLLCVITDNGIGRKRSSEINQMREKKHTSFATGATQRRLELLNQGREQNITVSYVDLKDENGNCTGTKVLLYIPLSA